MLESDPDHYLREARLGVITQRVGFVVWQLQELEGIAAQFLVLRTKAKKGMGVDAGQALVRKAENRTFGVTLREISEAKLFEPELQAKFESLLSERNWVVHKSRASSRSVIYSDLAANMLLDRLDKIAAHSLELMRAVSTLTESFVIQHGVSKQFIDRESEKTLAKWHGDDLP